MGSGRTLMNTAAGLVACGAMPFNSEQRYARYFLGGYFCMDFLTISSNLPSILEGSLFSSLAMARQTSERVAGSRRSITSVPSAYGTRTARVPQPYHPAGYNSTSVLRAVPNVYRTLRSEFPDTSVNPLAVRYFSMPASMRFLTRSLFRAGFLLFNWPSRMAKVLYLLKSAA